MKAPRRTTRRAFLACAAIAIGSACANEGDARDSGVDAGVNDGSGPFRAVALSAASAAHTCAFMNDSTARCWGLNDNGQLGVAPADSAARCRVRDTSPAVTVPCETRPRIVAGVTDVRQVGIGNRSTYVLRGNRTV